MLSVTPFLFLGPLQVGKDVLPTILEMPEIQALVKLSMDGMGWYAWVQPCIEASLLDSR